MPEKPIMHGRDHRPGGEDPIPGLGGTNLSYAYMQPSSLSPASGINLTALSLPSSTFRTNDSSMFEAASLSGVGGIHVMQAGTFWVMAAGWFDSGSATAGQFAQMKLNTTPGLFTNEVSIAPFMDFGGGDYEASTMYASLWEGGGSSVAAGNVVLVEACENSTGGANLDVGLQVFFVSSDQA